MATKDLTYGQATIRRILKKLEQPQELENAYARAILVQAVANAAGKPTPQARMAAANLRVEGANIFPSAGGPAAEVAIGSEFGSAVYRQFQQPPNPRGYWLYPAASATSTLAAGDRALEEVLQDAVKGH